MLTLEILNAALACNDRVDELFEPKVALILAVSTFRNYLTDSKHSTDWSTVSACFDISWSKKHGQQSPCHRVPDDHLANRRHLRLQKLRPATAGLEKVHMVRLKCHTPYALIQSHKRQRGNPTNADKCRTIDNPRTNC